MNAAIDRLPPHDIEAEEACIAALLVDPEAIPAVANILQPADFFREKNGWVLAAALDVWGRGEVVNQITVAHELAKHDRLEEVGGQTYLADIIRRLPTSIGIEFYAQIVKRDATYRGIIQASTAIMQMAYESPDDPDRVLIRADELLARLGQVRKRAHARTIGEILTGPAGDGKGGLIEQTQDFLDDPTAVRGLPTGWGWLDRAIGGYLARRLYIVMADTSIGKSLWTHWTAWQTASRGDHVVIDSTEMGGEEVTERILYMEAGVDPWQIRQHGASAAQRRAILDAAEKLTTWPITVIDVGGITLPMLVAEFRRQCRQADVALGIVDHIQQVVVPGEGIETPGAITATVNACKQVAMNEEVPMLAVSHVSRRAVEGKLSVHSGKGSASIEQGADGVLLLEPVRYDINAWALMSEDELDTARANNRLDVRLRVAKQRNGGGRSWAVRHLDWSQGGRFVPTPRGL